MPDDKNRALHYADSDSFSHTHARGEERARNKLSKKCLMFAVISTPGTKQKHGLLSGKKLSVRSVCGAGPAEFLFVSDLGFQRQGLFRYLQDMGDPSSIEH